MTEHCKISCLLTSNNSDSDPVREPVREALHGLLFDRNIGAGSVTCALVLVLWFLTEQCEIM